MSVIKGWSSRNHASDHKPYNVTVSTKTVNGAEKWALDVNVLAGSLDINAVGLGAGSMSVETLSDSSWTSISSEAGRRTMIIQNQGDDVVIVNYTNPTIAAPVLDTVGWRIESGGWKVFPVDDTLTVYALAVNNGDRILIDQLS